MSIEITQRVDEILKKAEIPDRHTFYQLEKFVIGKEPTGQAQLWQIVRELECRQETVESLRKELADAEDNLEIFDIKIERLSRRIKLLSRTEPDQCQHIEPDLEIREDEINIRKLERDKKSLQFAAQKVNKKLKCIIEEMNFLVKGFDQIVSQIGEMVPLDDEVHQKEMWNEKLLEEFNLRVILQRPLDPDFVKTVMCLHDDSSVKKHVTKVIENVQQQMAEQVKAQQVKNIANRPEVVANPKIKGK